MHTEYFLKKTGMQEAKQSSIKPCSSDTADSKPQSATDRQTEEINCA